MTAEETPKRSPLELGGEAARLADADTVREATGYAIGGVSPFDLPADVPVLLDESLERFDVVFPAAGTPRRWCGWRSRAAGRALRRRVARISHE